MVKIFANLAPASWQANGEVMSRLLLLIRVPDYASLCLT